jgi:hypothetical protein
LTPASNNYPLGTCCNSACIDTSIDPDNCGACGNACQAGEFCSRGACVVGQACTQNSQFASCALPSRREGECCSGTCIDLLNDDNNCDGCGYFCAAGTSCVGGLCVVSDGGITSCVPDTGNITVTCPAGSDCVNGFFACGVTTCAQAGISACNNNFSYSFGLGQCCTGVDGGCPDVQNDPNNCGECGIVCASGVCNQGVCFPVPSSGGCASLGGCPTGTVCAGGLCVQPASACPVEPGAEYCSTNGGQLGVCCGHEGVNPSCDDLSSDRNNCGSCFHVCASGQTCQQGQCR